MNKSKLSVILLAIFLFSNIAALAISPKPDFAYPKTVSATADKNLGAALKTGNGQEVVKSLIDYTLAQMLIDADNLPEAVGRIEAITMQEKDPCIKAILYTLLADIYKDIYSGDRWKYDQRNNPLLPLPADYNAWDGNQFKHKISSLSDSALADTAPLQSSPLKNYTSIIDCDKYAGIYYPTLYDFIAFRAIENLKNLVPSGLLFSSDWLCRSDIYLQLKFSYTSPIAKRILDIYQDLLRHNASRPAPFINSEISRIDFLADNVYSENGNTDKTTFSLYQDLYNKYSDSEYSGDILIKLGKYSSNIEENRWVVDAARVFLKKYPDYYNRTCISNIILDKTAQHASANTQSLIVPGDTLDIKINNRNTQRFSIDIYRIPNEALPLARIYNYEEDSAGKQPMLIKSIPVTCDQEAPFETDTIVKTTLEEAGCYFIIVNINGKTFTKRHDYNVIHSTNVKTYSVGYSNKQWVTAVNPLTGAPILNAEIFNRIYGRETKRQTENGVSMADSNCASPFFAKDKTSYSQLEHFSFYVDKDTTTNYRASCYTDLAIYRPGDTMEWTAIIYSQKGKNNQICSNRDFNVRIRDANYQQKSSATVRTDEWGRITGKFAIPKDGLTGRYHIAIESNNQRFANSTFMVSDYKLPTYFIEISEILKNNPEEGAVTLKGKTKTYSGFPLADAKISLSLSVSSRIWWFRGSNSNQSFYTSETKTDNNGEFIITLPAELLASSPIPDGIFSANIKAVSPTGESQETSDCFTLEKAYSIQAALPSVIEISHPVKLSVKISDINGNELNDTIYYDITKDEKIVFSGKFLPSNPFVDWINVPSGEYNITFSLKDKSQAEAKENKGVCLYRATDKMPPKETILWIPKNNYSIEASERKVAVAYGTTAENSNIEYFVWNSDSIYAHGRIAPAPGMHDFEIAIPDGVNSLTLSLITINNYKYSKLNINIEIMDSKPSIKINIESFRDKIVPGAKETWKFSVTDNTGNGSKSALIFDMYSKAMDQFITQSWRFSPYQTYANALNAASSFGDTSRYYTFFNAEKAGICINPGIPEIFTYGKTFNGTRKNRLMLYSAKNRVETSARVHHDDLNIEYVLVQEESSEEDTGDTGNNFSYRAAEEPLAFFKPLLTTNDDGRLTFSFTAPNANTTWRFCAIAYNANLLTDNTAFDVVSNKPIMVKPNMPRFLRTGDTANIQASVMNNSDTLQAVCTTVEIFDYATNSVLKQYTFDNTIEAGKAAVVSTPLTAPFDAPMIGYRIKSATADFADGEQSLIAVLPSSTPVIETLPFYIAPDSAEFAIQLPAMPNDARVTLQFCENPTWYCVTALPGLRTEDSRTSTAAATAIFSAAIAEGIMRNNPEIALAMKQWQESNKSDSTLTSMLEKNQDLKTVLLNSTPWVMDARSDTERMARLALLFDKEEIKQTYARNIKLLGQLQRGKGGWGWIAESKDASEWCTLNILEMFGDLKRFGYLPDDKNLSQLITNAVKYIDDVNARRYAKHPKGDYSQYVIIRDLYPEIKQSTAARRVTNATVQRLISAWSNESVTGKAIAATILNSHGYNSTARQVLNSLREYASSSPSKGMWWASINDMTAWSMGKIGATALILDAFNAVEPSCPEIDQIRQWLILQKEAKDWGSSVVTSQVIASLLNSGSKWTTNAHGALVKIGNENVTPSSFEKVTGYFRENISQMHPSGKEMSVIKTSKTPSWGAVYCQFTEQMTQVAPASCEAVSIEKRFYRQTATADGIKWENADSLTVGDKIKVELHIKTTQDMDYVAITDDRAACFEPVEQLPAPIFNEGIYFYRENRDAATNIFVTHLPKGTYLLTYELYTNNSGKFTSGIASIQSQYAPSLSAHSAGDIISVK